MSEIWGQPLITVIGAGILGGIVQYLTWWWQNQQKGWDIRVSLVTAMSEAAMGLMARFETVLDLGESADNSSVCAALNDASQTFAVNKAVVGTKLEAYLARPTIAKRWDKLADAMIDLVELRQLDAAHHNEHRENEDREKDHRKKLLIRLIKAMRVLVKCERPGLAHDRKNPEEVLQNLRDQLDRPRTETVEAQVWRNALDTVLERKRVLIIEVRDAPMAFHMPLLPFGKRASSNRRM
jgi:hypothetical protein